MRALDACARILLTPVANPIEKQEALARPRPCDDQQATGGVAGDRARVPVAERVPIIVRQTCERSIDLVDFLGERAPVLVDQLAQSVPPSTEVTDAGSGIEIGHPIWERARRDTPPGEPITPGGYESSANA
jgi:hypothetical protein